MNSSIDNHKTIRLEKCILIIDPVICKFITIWFDWRSISQPLLLRCYSAAQIDAAHVTRFRCSEYSAREDWMVNIGLNLPHWCETGAAHKKSFVQVSHAPCGLCISLGSTAGIGFVVHSGHLRTTIAGSRGNPFTSGKLGLEWQLGHNILQKGPRMNFDLILAAIGGFGKYQKILYIWICLPQVLLAFHMMVSIFTGATPPHLCLDSLDPAARNQTSDYTALSLNFSQADSCFWSKGALQGNRTEHSLCAHGWLYSNETFHSTTVTEWDLVCEDARWNSLGSSIYMFGLLVGSMVFGAMADRYGRRLILLLSIALQTVFGVAVAFAPNFFVYAILRFIVGTAISGVIINAFVLGTEWTCTKRRMLAGIITDYAFGLGYMLLAGIAYLIRDWRKLQLAISAPGFLLIFYIWCLKMTHTV